MAGPVSQAFGEMKKYGFGADFLHPEFKKFVLAYVPTAAGADPAAAPGCEGQGGRRDNCGSWWPLAGSS